MFVYAVVLQDGTIIHDIYDTPMLTDESLNTRESEYLVNDISYQWMAESDLPLGFYAGAGSSRYALVTADAGIDETVRKSVTSNIGS